MTELYHLIIFGPQGSGKGTQAKLLADKFGLVYLGLGDIFREMAEEDTAMGQRVRKILEAGQLVPDDVTDQLVAQKIGDIPPSTGFILDGYPRNEAQAESLHRTLNGLSRLIPVPVIISLEVPRGELLKRLNKRREIEGRHDDVGPVIEERLKIYEKHTAPILDNAHEWARLLKINGNQPVAGVTKEIEDKLHEED